MRSRRTPLVVATALAALLASTAATAGADPGRDRPDQPTPRPTTAERLVAYAEAFDAVLDLPGAGKVVLDTEAGALQLFWDGAVPDPASALVAAAPPGISARVVDADHSMAELDRSMTRAWDAAVASGIGVQAAQATDDLSGIVITVEEDTLSARTTTRRPLRSLLQRHVGVPVRVRVVADELTPLSRTDDSPPWQGGARMTVGGTKCTTGFTVVGRTTGIGYILSAGHCDWDANAAVYDGGGDLIAGTAASAVRVKQAFDSLLIDPVSGTVGEMYRGGINAPATNEDDVTGAANPAVGAPVCISGAASGEHCADMEIENADTYFNCHPNEDKYLRCPGFIVTNTADGLAASAGDSGAGVFVVKTDGSLGARGIVSAGSRSRGCPVNVWGPDECFSRFYAVNIKTLEQEWDVRVETE